MHDVVSMTGRGTITLPAHIRKTLGITGGQQFIVAATPEGGLVLHPAATVPVEIYSEARIHEFAEEEGVVSEWLRSRRKKPS